jgi:hypothetical protein
MAPEFRKQIYGQYVNLESGTVRLKCLDEREEGVDTQIMHYNCRLLSLEEVHFLSFAICCSWFQILESSQVLLNMVQREASCLEQTVAKQMNVEEARSLGMFEWHVAKADY